MVKTFGREYSRARGCSQSVVVGALVIDQALPVYRVAGGGHWVLVGSAMKEATVADPARSLVDLVEVSSEPENGDGRHGRAPSVAELEIW